jgi:cell division protein FtsB
MIAEKKHLKRGDSLESKFLPVILGILFLVIIGFLVISNYRINKKRAELQAQIKSLEEQIKILEEKKAKLQTGISVGESESFLEKEARDKLGLKKPGEEVVVVTPPKEENATTTKENKTLWQKLLERIGF